MLGLLRIVSALALICCAPLVSAQADSTLEQRARALFNESPLIDGHNDTPWQYRTRVKNHLGMLDLRADLTQLPRPMHTDIGRLRTGGMGAQFWSVYVPATLKGADAVQATFEQIDIARRIVEKYSDVFEVALTAEEIERIHRQGKIASLFGMEGGHSIGNSLAALRMLYLAGARYLTLTHSCNIDWADSATDEPEHDGLTAFGREVVREMNRLGMMVDLSHVHALTMHDALDVSEAPIIFSHSSARGVTNHPRNVPDDVLDRLPKNDGVVMVTFLSSYVSEEFSGYANEYTKERQRLVAEFPDDEAKVSAGLDQWRAANPRPVNATIGDVADHIDHIRNRIGVEYLGVGGDYDGTTFLPDGLEDVSTYPALFAELLRRGYSDEDVKKIAGLNLLRVMRKVEDTAERLQREREASDVLIEELDKAAGQ